MIKMANIKSSKKSARTDIKRRAANRSRMNAVRTYIKNLEKSISGGVIDEIRASFVKAQSQIFKAVTAGVIKKNKASRTVSRLNARCKAVVLAGK